MKLRTLCVLLVAVLGCEAKASVPGVVDLTAEDGVHLKPTYSCRGEKSAESDV